jgi:large subunit ribosomal protein L15
MISLHNLSPRPGSRFEKRRLGRGPGSGLGKTGGRGTKGQHSREGIHIPRGFEGGQTPLFRRIPKRGFVPPFSKRFLSLNLRDLSPHLRGGEVVDLAWLRAKGFIKSRRYEGVRILGEGTIDVLVTFRVQGVSASARSKIESAGGKVEILPPILR